MDIYIERERERIMILYNYIYICPYIISFLHRAYANLRALHISLLNLEAHSHPRQAVQVAPGAPVPAAQTPGTRAWRHGCNGRCRPSRRSSLSCASAVNSQGKHLILRCKSYIKIPLSQVINFHFKGFGGQHLTSHLFWIFGPPYDACHVLRLNASLVQN